MKCSEVERILSEVLDGASSGTFPTDVDAHVKSCPDCSDLASDLKLIASEARQLAASEEPAPRVWLRIAAELRAEGLIRDSSIIDSSIIDSSTRDSEPAFARPVIVPVPVPASPGWRWSALWLAPVAAAVLAAGAYVIGHKPAPQVAKLQVPPPAVASPAQVTQAAPVPAAPQQVAKKSVAPAGGNVNGAGNGSETGPAVEAAVEAEASTEDQQFLSVVSTLGPSTRATYENQLKAVNADIRETQAYVDRNPQDVDARQHLMDAYQQKALLYQIALDRIQ